MPKEGQVLSPKVKQQLAGYAAKLRAQWETEKSTLSKKWDPGPRRKRHIHPDPKCPKWGYLKTRIKIILLFWFIIILISCLSLVGLLCIILHAWVWKSLKPYLSLRKEFIPVNLRISKVPSYWRWSLLLKSGSFSDVPSYSRTPLIRDSRVTKIIYQCNNFGEPRSNSKIEPPFLIIR